MFSRGQSFLSPALPRRAGKIRCRAVPRNPGCQGRGQASGTARGAGLRDELDSTDDLGFGPDSEPEAEEDPSSVMADSEDTIGPGSTAKSWRSLSPQLADIVARAFGFDPAAVERAIDRILEDAEGFGKDVAGRLEAMDLWAWLMAASVTAAAVEIARREARAPGSMRSRPGVMTCSWRSTREGRRPHRRPAGTLEPR